MYYYNILLYIIYYILYIILFIIYIFFFPSDCMANEYVSPTNFSCLPCPSNTMLFNEGVAICQCEPGYFRAPGETADFGCTRKIC